MPKENTHLWFAYDMIKRTGDIDMSRLIGKHISQYLLGSVSPDTFFYETSKSIEDISIYIHGESGAPTNETIIACLDDAKSPDDIAFILGFITHCALDIIWHPVIYYLTGNYYNSDINKLISARYRHSLFETGLDISIANTLKIHKLLNHSSFEELAFNRYLCSKFHKNSSDLSRALEKQLFVNMLCTSSLAHIVFKPFLKNRVIGSPNLLGLFYRQAEISFSGVAQGYQIRDIITGKLKNVTLKGLFEKAFIKAGLMMHSAWLYYLKRITKEELVHAIPGENLSTGRNGFFVSDIKYTLENETVQ